MNIFFIRQRVCYSYILFTISFKIFYKGICKVTNVKILYISLELRIYLDLDISILNVKKDLNKEETSGKGKNDLR